MKLRYIFILKIKNENKNFFFNSTYINGTRLRLVNLVLLSTLIVGLVYYYIVQLLDILT